MTDVVLFHHALGLTPGVEGFADRLRAGGHAVHTPDLFDGHAFTDIADGVAFAERIGFDTVIERGRTAAAALPSDGVCIGISLGVLPAQALGQTRADCRAAVLLDACIPLGEFGDEWPADVALQIHGMDADPFFAGEGDLEAAQHLVSTAPRAELFTYPGSHHLFIDDTQPSHEPAAAALCVERILDLLGRLDQ